MSVDVLKADFEDGLQQLAFENGLEVSNPTMIFIHLRWLTLIRNKQILEIEIAIIQPIEILKKNNRLTLHS